MCVCRWRGGREGGRSQGERGPGGGGLFAVLGVSFFAIFGRWGFGACLVGIWFDFCRVRGPFSTRMAADLDMGMGSQASYAGSGVSFGL